MTTRRISSAIYIASFSTCLVLLLSFYSMDGPPAAAADKTTDRNDLVILTKGMNDEVSNTWTQFADALSPSQETIVILQGGETFNKIPVVGKLLTPHPATVNRSNIIRIDDPDSPQSQELLKQLGAKPNAKILVDMYLGLRVSESSWKGPTTWASKVIRTIAESHVEQFPTANTVLVGHSAGTEPIADLPERIGNSSRPLFSKRIAISPRREGDYPPGTICIFKDGDFYYSPKGRITPGTVFKVMGEQEAKDLAKKGYTVVRVASQPGPVFEMESGGLASLAASAAQHLEKFGKNIGERIPAHTGPTLVSEPQEKILIYSPNSEERIELKNGSVLAAVQAINRSSTSAGNEGRSAFKDIGQLKDAVKELTANEPTPGLGGISLNATAQVPINPREVERAGYDPHERRLYLTLHGGKTLWLPRAEPQTLHEGLEFGYRRDKKPELSISNTFFDLPDGRRVVNLTPSGRQPVYYFGDTEDTLLGMVMYLADQALGKLTFGSTADVKPVADEVPGFTSMPELYPQKYTERPASDNYLGSESRVFIHPYLVELVRNSEADELVYGDTRFAVEFGKMGPAEVVYAAFLESHFHEVANTEQGKAFRQLIAYARVLAIFRWLKENRIAFVDGGLSKISVPAIHTPRDAVPFTLPSPAQIAPSPPAMLFGPAGLLAVVNQEQKQTTVTYKNGRPVEVRRHDGDLLEIFRDDLGRPVAIRMNGAEGAAFLNDPVHGLVLAANLKLQGSGRNLSVQVNENTVLLPEKRPEETIARMVARFALE